MPQYNHPHENEITFFGKTTFRNKERRFGIKTDDRRRHMYIVGKTGMGKSTLLENMIQSDIQVGHGVVVVDPHGDLAEKALNFVPSDRINDTIYFDPVDAEKPIAFNVLEHVEPQYRNLVASGLVGVFKKIWADSWGPRLEYILMNTILALLDYQNSTLLGINRMLVDEEYRAKVVAKVEDPIVKAFWVREYAKYNDRFMVEAIAPIQNKVGQFLSSSTIRNIVGQPKSTLNMRDIMDNHKILILNLAKGKIGEEIGALLGAMIITKLQLAAMSRADTPEEERLDFYMYVDEFQNFATESFADILSEARKYRLNLIIAHQYITQMEEEVRDAVFGNVGTILVNRVGAMDAEFMENEFMPVFEQQDLVNLRKFHFYIKLMIDGVASSPFSGVGLPPVKVENPADIEKIRKVSRERYGRDKSLVDERIMRWSGFGPGGEIYEIGGAGGGRRGGQGGGQQGRGGQRGSWQRGQGGGRRGGQGGGQQGRGGQGGFNSGQRFENRGTQAQKPQRTSDQINNLKPDTNKKDTHSSENKIGLIARPSLRVPGISQKKDAQELKTKFEISSIPSGKQSSEKASMKNANKPKKNVLKNKHSSKNPKKNGDIQPGETIRFDS